MKLFLVALTLLTLGLYSTESSAQIFRLNFTPAGGMNPVIRAAIEAEVQKAEDEINSDLPSASTPSRLMEGMANSSVLSGKGVGSDYASGMEVFLIGAGVGLGADLEKNKDADADLSGAGVQGGLILGTNLGWMDTQKILGLETNKLNVYFNFFKYDLDKASGDTDIKGDLSSYGIHFRYDWITGSDSIWFGWGGVKVHTGYEYNSTKLKLSSKIEENIEVTEAGGTYTSNIVGNPFAQIDVSTFSIPLEISTSLRFLYFFTLYGGLGADYNSGTAKGSGDLNSNSAAVNCSGVCSPSAGNVGTIDTTANIDGEGKVNPFLFRGFAGLQLHLPYIRVYGQVDKAFGSELVGASAGVRFVF
jgi:hypothetical protein